MGPLKAFGRGTAKVVNWLNAKGPFVTAIATVVIAALTGTYVHYSRAQWKVMLEANRINRESLEDVQRAYISFQGIQARKFIFKGKGGSDETLIFEFGAEMLNAGNTPSNSVAQWFYGDNLSDEPNEEQFKGNPTHNTKVIGPKTPYDFGGARRPIDFFESGPETTGPFQVPTLHHKFFVWGWIAYNDIFPNTTIHITEFCQLLSGMGGGRRTPPFDPNASWTFKFEDCKQHNCADEHCDDYKDILAAATEAPPN